MRRVVVASAAVFALFAATALAGVPAGQYSGHYGKHAAAKVSFTVKGSSLIDFHAFVPAFCGWDNLFVFQTFFVPKAKIRNGKVKTTYVIRNSKGARLGTAKLTATFHGHHAHGTLGGADAGCTVATYTWTAS